MENLLSKSKDSVAVIGSGAWGTVLATLLAKNCKSVYLWSRTKEQAQLIEKDRKNISYLPTLDLEENIISIYGLDKRIKSAKIIIFSIPLQHLRERFLELKDLINFEDTIIINAGKGIENSTWYLPSQIIKDVLPNVKIYGSLSGPNIASEIAEGKYAEALLCLNDKSASSYVSKCFETDNFKVETINDLMGLEISGALKNIVAIAAGFCDGMALGANTKALVLIKGLSEIKMVGSYLGADERSFTQDLLLADLIATCSSNHSRNRSVGQCLGRGLAIEEAVKSLKGRLCEGIFTIKVCNYFKDKNIHLPLMLALDELIDGKITTKECLDKILKPE